MRPRKPKHVYWLKRVCLFTYLCIISCFSALAGAPPPGNDNCTSATTIDIPNGGYNLGTFKSTPVDISSATIQTGETFAPAILVANQTQKSIWFKFSIPTTRSVRVTLTQPGIDIAAGDVGFTVYKTTRCLPANSDVSTKLTPIALFGNTYHPCVEPGEYLVQVSAKNSANGVISINLDIALTGAVYDSPKDAQEFGMLTSPSNTAVDFDIECQSLEDANETCIINGKKQPYTRSTWHTFTTPAYFDYLGLVLAKHEYSSGNDVVGFRLYKGDAKKSGISSLAPIGDCDSLVLNNYYINYKTYTCNELDKNTTYTLQLFYKEDFTEKVRLAIELAGSTPTKGPEPILSKIAAGNQLGILSSGSGAYTYFSDQLACNARHSDHPCAYNQPATGVTYQGKNYNISTFYTFTLTSTSQIDMSVSSYTCGYNYLFRVYQQEPTANCTDLNNSKLVGEFVYRSQLDCLPAGKYTVQVLGRDTVNTDLTYYYYAHLGYNNPLCLRRDLGRKFDVIIQVKTIREASLFSLANKDAFDKVNGSGTTMTPLEYGKTYQAVSDTFGCNNTVLPAGEVCKTNQSIIGTKAMYREFTVTDTGMITFSDQYWYRFSYKLFKGDAATLATQQNVFAYPQTIKNLTPYSECIVNNTGHPVNVCLVPGTYTYTTFGSTEDIGLADRPKMKYELLETKHNSLAKAQDMGNLWDSVRNNNYSRHSDVDYFSCRDNAVAINGTQPCTINGKTATKAIYRTFYLKKAAVVSIQNTLSSGYGGYLKLFSGKATDGAAALKPMGSPWDCFMYSASTPNQCNPLPAGWYTVVSYGIGTSYNEPMKDLNGQAYSSHTGLANQFTIHISQGCPEPQYNHPYRAAIDSLTKKPFLIEWKPRAGHTETYPKTDTTFTLYTENFNCNLDTPFKYVTPCNTTVNRVAYYVFQTTQESFVQIDTKGYWGSVYALDVRKDSLSMKAATPIQPCLKSPGHVQLCKLQPGTYTLVIFVEYNYSCTNVQPTIYVDKVGYSRFDFATKAYDFGVVPADSAYHNGKAGDVNPQHKDRAPSSDFFYCTTGAQKNDPTERACYVDYLPSIYNPGNNNALYTQETYTRSDHIPRRNLWYTFVIDKPGFVRIKVKNKTPGKNDQWRHQYPFAVYKSNVDGTMPFTEVVSNGQVDSTYAQGLTFIKDNNSNYGFCQGSEEITFFRDPCSNTVERYYILVDNRNTIYYGVPPHEMTPNSQLEVSIQLDSVNNPLPKFDHYYQASDIGKLGAGKHKGDTDNYSCATADATDPVYGYKYCAKKTLWYKFTATVTGNVRYRIKAGKDYKYYYQDVQLFREIIKGDSTTKGLDYEAAATTTYQDGSYWSQNCISKGTYYLLLTGCEKINEDVYPEIEIIESAGDYCSAPLTAKITGAGSSEARLIVDCHTIGTDYGEFGPKLTCPEGVSTALYKSSWFRIDITGKDTLDVTAYIEETTNAASSEIKYRMMTGDCGAMQEQSCVQDALTQNTYECLIPGQSYFIQVLTPVLKNGYPVTGDIKLRLSAKQHADKCSPPPPCLANANFQTQFDCNKDSAVRFINYSTYGSSIKYTWDFGYNNKTSNEVSPSFLYPALTTDQTYKVRLITENTGCGKKDTAEAIVAIPARPYINLGEDISLCEVGATITLDATSHDGATYRWQNGSNNPTFTVQSSGRYQYSVKVDYKTCSSSDTINVFINPMKKNPLKNVVLCSETVQLSGYRGYGETYQWNNGETGSSINVKQPGVYWVDISLHGCSLRDSFVVSTLEEARPLGNDTTVCLQGTSYKLDATVSGASSYSWQDGKTGAQYNVTKAGIYRVDINLGTCTIRDSITITAATAPTPVITGPLKFCAGDSVLLDAGSGYSSYVWSNGATTQKVYAARGGSYQVTVTNNTGCSGTSAAVQVTNNNKPKPSIAGNRPLCYGDSLTLNGGSGYSSYAWSTGETSSSIKVKSNSKMILVVTDQNGCTGKDSVVVSVGAQPIAIVKDTAICQGTTYKLPSGKQVGTTGIYKDTLRNKGGCDSLYFTTSLNVKPVVRTSRNAAICAGQTYTLPSGRTVTASGTYIETFASATGCDSIITIHLVVSSSTTTTMSVTICEGQSYKLPSGRIVRDAGTYAEKLQAASGCDSTVVTNLVVKTTIHQTTTASICEGATYKLPSGKWINTAGTHKDTTRGIAGCDSLITNLTLRIITIQRQSTTASICEGQVYTLPWGRVVTAAGIYRDTVHTTSGCDSIISTATLTVKPRLPFGIRPSANEICIGGSVQLTAFGGDNYQWLPADGMVSSNGASATVTPTTTTVYKAVVSNPVCDAMDTVHTRIIVHPNPVVAVTKSNDVDCMIGICKLNATGGSKYLWSPSTTLSNPGIQNPVASPSATTIYKVKVTSEKGCVAEETVQVNVNIDNARFELPNAFTPNGDGKNDCFGVRSWGAVSDLKLSIFSRWGELLYETTDPTSCWDGTFKGQKLPTAVFVYQVSANTICGKVYRKGTVTLIR